MRVVVAPFLVVVLFSLFIFCGLFAGSAGAALANDTVDPKLGIGWAWLAVVGCPALALAALPLPSVLEGWICTAYEGYSGRFWQLLMVLLFVFGLFMGIGLPNAPFNGP